MNFMVLCNTKQRKIGPTSVSPCTPDIRVHGSAFWDNCILAYSRIPTLTYVPLLFLVRSLF